MAVDNKKTNARQPADRRLSSKRSGRRAKKLSLSSGKQRVEISLRYFKTTKSSRTKLNSQIVFPTFIFAVREIAITKRGPYHKKRLHFYRKLAGATALFSGVLGLLYFSGQFVSTPHINVQQKGQVKAAAITVDSKHYPKSLPNELLIPKIGVDAEVQPTGLNTDGSLAVPSDYHATGWYTGSPTPGEIGPSIIDGHVDNVNGIGVFWRLREIVSGDTFQIARQDSSVVSFKVDKVEQLPQNQFPTNEVYGKISYAGVRLITCGGVFNSPTGHYSDNIVIFAHAL